MATFVLIHGAGDSGWYWHLREAELRRRGHDVVAPDLPGEDDSARLPEYADTVVDMAFGRDTAGVHFRRDEIEGIVLGEWYRGNTPAGLRPDGAG
jgi:pimeloyl-ACP methyl ester carboxylesterase